MDAPAPVHLKEMYKVIRHVLSTKGYGLKFELRKDIVYLGTSYVFVEFQLLGEAKE